MGSPSESDTGTVDPAGAALDDVAEHLYGLHPDEFVPARDDAVAQAREAGDRELAKAVGRLRRPTRAAWLANLLARERGEQLDGLLALADELASAQRTLDGGALRVLSAQRSRLVAAMAREGGRLAARSGDTAAESVVRDLVGILEAALADPDIAAEVRSGRLTRTVSYSGFGPSDGGGGGGSGGGGAAGPAARARTAPRPTAAPDRGNADEDRADEDRADQAERDRAERAERERTAREQELADAERSADEARDRQDSAEASAADAESTHEAAKAQVADLTAELEAARQRERTAGSDARQATSAARDAAREAGTATTRAERARARLAELTDS